MAIPGAKVDRESFLRAQLQSHCSPEVVSKAIMERPANAGISDDLIDRLVTTSINAHAAKVSAISFATGLPGGWAVLAAVPADMAQFSWHVIVLSQKLAYLYGWPNLFGDEDDMDHETGGKMTLLVGSMMGCQLAVEAISKVANRVAVQTAKRIPRVALTKYPFYMMSKQVAKWLGVSLTKQSFAKSVAKVVPILGGILSGGITLVMVKTMAGRLKSHLRTLYFARPDTR
jgi:uncharacterized membrane protein